MHIFYFTDMFPTISEIFISREIAGLEKLGIEISVLADLDPLDGVDHELNRKLHAHRYYFSAFKSGKVKKGLCHLKYLILNPRAYIRAMRRSNMQGLPEMKILFRQIPLVCDLVKKSGAKHIHCHHGRVGMLAGWLASRMLGIQFSVTLHGSDVLYTPYENLGTVLKEADLIVCVSEKIRNTVMISYEIQAEKTALIRCGIPISDYTFPQSLTSKLKILTVARLEPVKGLCNLIQACGILRDRNILFECTIVGDGTEREVLQRKINDLALSSILKLIGSLPNERLPEVYAEHSLFVLPSYSEGAGVVIMEAMACGLPVIASKVGGITEIITDEENGFLVEPGNPEQIADAIVKCINMADEHLEALRHKNRNKIIQQFNSTYEIDKLSSLFSDMQMGTQS